MAFSVLCARHITFEVHTSIKNGTVCRNEALYLGKIQEQVQASVSHGNPVVEICIDDISRNVKNCVRLVFFFVFCCCFAEHFSEDCFVWHVSSFLFSVSQRLGLIVRFRSFLVCSNLL